MWLKIIHLLGKIKKMTKDYRRDGRSDEEFKKQIKERTIKEKFLVDIFANECKHRGWTVTYRDNGVDNSGEFQEKATTDADYLISINGNEELYEIKNSPVKHKCTFKVHNLKQYVKQKANILLFYATGNINSDYSKINYENTRWAIIKPEKIQLMLDLNDHYNERMFGNKLCVKILEQDYPTYFESEKLTYVYAT